MIVTAWKFKDVLVSRQTDRGREGKGGRGRDSERGRERVRAVPTIDAWFNASLRMRTPLPPFGPMRDGMVHELVANPIPTTMAAGLPTKRAVRDSIYR